MAGVSSVLSNAIRSLSICSKSVVPCAVQALATGSGPDGRRFSQAVDHTSTNSASDSHPDDSVKASARHARKKLAPFFNNSEGIQTARMPDGARVPWTPSSRLDKRKTYQRRVKHILNVLDQEYVAQVAEEKRHFPAFKAGDVITVDLVWTGFSSESHTNCTYS